ncbi:ATP-binding protein [Actinomadura sp. SCN-SB]|uniref:ATP-binding protein n=1 Tax=Actinomadura sp. SCN-SB TaxID=3373092 RepID=UPI00375125F0
MSAEQPTVQRPDGPATAAATMTAAVTALVSQATMRTRVPLDGLDLPAVHASVPRARAFMRTLVNARGIAHVRDDAEILVSELVTNALRHATTAASTLRLRVLRVGERLRIEVHDPSPLPPRVRRVDLMDETGRGWFLVAAIADRLGSDVTASGKSVWCELTAWPAPFLEPSPDTPCSATSLIP